MVMDDTINYQDQGSVPAQWEPYVSGLVLGGCVYYGAVEPGCYWTRMKLSCSVTREGDY